MNQPIHVFSEIGKLKTVLLKRPGNELENLTPATMERLLFDDIPFLKIAQKEHDTFATVLLENDVECLYLEKLTAEALDAGRVREQFLQEMLKESVIVSKRVEDALFEYLNSFETLEMLGKLMAGVRKRDIDLPPTSLTEKFSAEEYPFFFDPMPNLYFTRDTSSAVGNGILINKMHFKARQREGLFTKYIMKYHPRFASFAPPIWLDQNTGNSLEGGDVLVLSPKVIAIGISQRTAASSIEKLAETLFARNSGFEKILAVKIPNVRAMMHLDTVFTMVDKDKFIYYPQMLKSDGTIDLYTIEAKGDDLKVTYSSDLAQTLAQLLEVPEVALISTGDGDQVAASREQWNDGSNTLAIAPGVVITYDRNYLSNKVLRSYGVKVLEIPSSELSRGRGGPHCMSQAFVREDL